MTLMRSLAAAASLTCMLTGAQAQADKFPSKPITLVNPYAVGGPADLLGRAVAKGLGDALGQTVVVENKAGGGASIGAAYVAKSAPDGYTLLLGTAAAHTVTPAATTVPYNGIADFAFIGMVANVYNVLTVHPSVKAANVKELIELAKAEPGKLSYASAGMGSSPHIGGETFKHVAQVDIVHVPYRGAAPAATDMVAGMAQVGFLNISGVLPFVKAGKLRALAYAGPHRTSALPDVPTLAEAGVPNAESGSWYSLAVPAKTPPEVIDRLAKALAALKSQPEFKAALAAQNAEGMPQMREKAADFVREDGKRLAELVKATRMKLQE
jgi:tripartite-type tricarboxylate transporter receptor subunit TctC